MAAQSPTAPSTNSQGKKNSMIEDIHIPHLGIPKILIDIITQDILEDPVTAEDGHVYSRKSICNWFETCQRRNIAIISPRTRKLMGSKLTFNPDIQYLLSELHDIYKTFKSPKTLSPSKAKQQQQNFSAAMLTEPIHPISLRSIPSLKNISSIFRRLSSLSLFSESDILSNWKNPRLTVIGNEGSGKSTLLERLLMMSIFPRGKETRTKMPIHVKLRYSRVPSTPTLDLIDTTTGLKIIESLPLPSLDDAHLDVMAAMMEAGRKESTTESGSSSSSSSNQNRLIVVYIQSPLVPSMDIVDLPGIATSLVRTPSQGESSPPRSRLSVVEKYIQANSDSHYLALVEAGSRFSGSLCLDYIQKYNLQSNTIGVITKCDLVSSKTLAELRRSVVLQDNVVGSVPLQPHGYVCSMQDSEYDDNESIADHDDGISEMTESDMYSVRSMLSKDQSNYSRLIRQDTHEYQFFENMKLNDLIESGHAGLRSVVNKIENIYLRALSDDLIPKVLRSLLQKIENNNTQIKSLGYPSPPQQNNSDYKLFKEEVIKAIDIILASSTNEVINDKYCADILQPLLNAVSATSTGEMKISNCFDVQNSVEFFLNNLRDKIQSIYLKSIEKSKRFWIDFVENNLKKDVSFFKFSRFGTAIDCIIRAVKKEVEDIFSDIESSMNEATMQVIGSVNLFNGVTAKYDFINNKSVTVYWDASVLGHSLVYHLTRNKLLLKIERLRILLLNVVDDLDYKVWQESCGKERLAIKYELETIETQFKDILNILISYKCEVLLLPRSASSVQGNDSHCCARLKEADLNPLVLLQHDFSIEHLKAGNFTASDLFQIGISPLKLFSAGYDMKEIRKCGVNMSIIFGQTIQDKKQLSHLVKSGLSFQDLKDYGFDFVSLLNHDCELSSKLYTIEALMLVDLSDNEKSELYNRGIMQKLLLFLLEQQSDDTKEKILSLFCRLADGNMDKDLQNQISHIMAISPLLMNEKESVRYVGVKSLRYMTCNSADSAGYVMRTNVLDMCVKLIKSDTDRIRIEVSLLLSNISIWYSGDIIELGYVSHLVSCVTSNDASSECRDAAAFALCLLAAVEKGTKQITDLCGVVPLIALLLHVIPFADHRLDNAMNVILKGINNLSDKTDVKNKEFLFMSLIHVLSSENLCHKSDSLAIIRSLCLASGDNKKAFANIDIIKPLVALLSIQENEINQKAIEILMKFVNDDVSYRLRIVSLGGLEPLISMIGNACSNESKKCATTLLIQLATEECSSISIVEEGAVDKLCDMLYDPNEEYQEIAAATLRSLAYVDENRSAIASVGVIDPLVSILRDGKSASLKIMVCRTLRNLSFNCNDNKIAIANLGGIQSLVDMLYEDNITGDAGKIVAAGVLQNLVYKIPENALLVIEAGALPLLAEIIIYGISEAKEAAAGAVRNLADEDNNCILIYRTGVLDALVGMLRSSVTSTSNAAKEALRTIALNDMCRSHLKSAGIEKKDIGYKHRKTW